MLKKPFSKDVLKIDPEREFIKIAELIRTSLREDLKRRGLIVGLSGGIDSSVTCGIAVRAIGAERILGLQMPENHSSLDTLRLSQEVAKHFGVKSILEDISDILVSVKYYDRYNDAVRLVIPEYGHGWKSKIVLSSSFDQKKYNLFSIIAQTPGDKLIKKRLTLQAYLEIVAATNFKQRIRKMLEYYHADRVNYAVAGTPNRLEYDQGFFVKFGDGSADIKPIAHLYKTQVYQLAEYLGIPDEIIQRRPSTDTYSLDQGQDEFFFLLPYDQMDLCLYAKNNDIPIEEVSEVIGLGVEQLQLIYDDIEVKRASARYLHMQPLVVDDFE
jgi:NAD+ synthase